MSLNVSRAAMHAAAPGIVARLCRTHADEDAYEEYFGAHPLDNPEFTGWTRETERRDVYRRNRAAGRRLSYVCRREDRARTRSTAQLVHELREAEQWALEAEADPAAVNAIRLSVTHLLQADGEGAAKVAVRALVSAVREARRTALATCPPEVLADIAAVRRRLRERRATTATLRRSRLEAGEPEPFAATELPPVLHDDLGPPGLDVDPDALTLRANLAARPTAEQLTRALVLAPGAPSGAVCV